MVERDRTNEYLLIIKVIAALLAIPVVSFIISHKILSDYRVNRETYEHLTLMMQGAVLAGVTAILLMAFIALAGFISKFNRKLLLYTFKPGLYITIVVLIILIILHASLAMAGLFFAEAIYIERVHVGIILGIGIGALYCIFAMIKASFGIVKRASIFVIGKPLNKKEQPTIWNFIADLAKKIDALPPNHIIVGLDTDFYVTEADVKCFEKEFKGRTMYLSLPLCRILSVSELEAIVGHELGHYKGLDTEFSEKFFPIYKGTVGSLAAIGRHMDEEGAHIIAILPAFFLLSYFLYAFMGAERKISRERELAADQVAAQVAGTKKIATALVKIIAFSRFWGTVYQFIYDALSQGKQIINVSSFFAEMVKANSNLDALQGIEDKEFPHPIDTHPPLTLRLQSLKTSFREITDESLRTTPESMAIELVQNYEDIEKELSEVEHHLLIQSGQVKVGGASNDEQSTIPRTAPWQ